MSRMQQPRQLQNTGLTASDSSNPPESLKFGKRCSNTLKSVGTLRVSVLTVGALNTLVLGGFLSLPYFDRGQAGMTDKERVEYRVKVWGTQSQVLTGLVANVATVVVALFSISSAQKTASESQKTSRETLRLTRQGQDSDRFNQATELLSSKLAYKQVSGLNSLHFLALTDPLYGLLVEQLLASFLREATVKKTDGELMGIDKGKALSSSTYLVQVNSKRMDSPLQWALTFLLSNRERRNAGKTPDEMDALYLCDLDLSFLTFAKTYLCGVIFVGSDLRGACFDYSNLVDCHFLESDLRGAKFNEAKLSRVNFAGADISQADFTDATGLTWEELLNSVSTGGTILPNYLLDSPDIPEDFDRDYYDEHGWEDPVYCWGKKLEEQGKSSNP